MKKSTSKIKAQPAFHPRNRHQGHYDFGQILSLSPEFESFLHKNKHGNITIDFSDPAAVRKLNANLLKLYYGINYWQFPKDYLCPPIPGRADYIHHIADLLSSSHAGVIPQGASIKCLDIGMGASCIYPILGTMEYGWSFVGTDIDPISVKSANNIIEKNESLSNKIEIRLQNDPDNIFKGVINTDEQYDLTICNPPFHASMQDAGKGSLRKIKNLKQKYKEKPKLNFGGQPIELSCKGGEKQFIKKMIKQSQSYSKSILWFTTLVSKDSNLPALNNALDNVEVSKRLTIPMNLGNKKSRILAWTFTKELQAISRTQSRK